jgi:hypothetical protein
MTLACLASGALPATADPPPESAAARAPSTPAAAPLLDAFGAHAGAGRDAELWKAPGRSRAPQHTRHLTHRTHAGHAERHRRPHHQDGSHQDGSHQERFTENAPMASGPRIFTGRGFDTCTAPSLDVLQSWRRSTKYGAVGVYIGGRNRACAQPRLTDGWVRSANDLGWALLPLYVGAQSPCLDPHLASARSSRIDPRRAAAMGTADGRDAARAATRLGLGPSSPVYLDMEAYPPNSAGCSTAVMQYTAGWTRAVRSAGFLAGYYSADGGIVDMSAVALKHGSGSGSVPDAVWYARWDARASTDGYGSLRRGLWTGHRRVHQYQGNVLERHGGVTLLIDRNAVDAPVAVVLPGDRRRARRAR